MARMNWGNAKRNPYGYNPNSPRVLRSKDQWRETRKLIDGALPFDVKPAPLQRSPFLGYDRLENDPRVTYVGYLRYGKLVLERGSLAGDKQGDMRLRRVATPSPPRS